MIFVKKDPNFYALTPYTILLYVLNKLFVSHHLPRCMREDITGVPAHHIENFDDKILDLIVYLVKINNV